jgi:hypothetical protein
MGSRLPAPKAEDVFLFAQSKQGLHSGLHDVSVVAGAK